MKVSMQGMELFRPRPHTCNTLPIVLFLVSFHSNFVTANDSIQAVVVTEPLGDIRSKLHTDTSLTWSAARFRLRVSPKHLHHQPSLTWLALVVSVELANIIQGNLIIRE